MDLYFDVFLISKKKKKKAISYVGLCVVCMRVLHGDLQMIHGDFQLFYALHCYWCVSEYKSVLLLFNYTLVH